MKGDRAPFQKASHRGGFPLPMCPAAGLVGLLLAVGRRNDFLIGFACKPFHISAKPDQIVRMSS